MRPSTRGSRLTALPCIDLAPVARNRVRCRILALLPICLLARGSIVDDVDLVADNDGGVGIGVAVEVRGVCGFDGVGLCYIVVSVVLLAASVVVGGYRCGAIVALALARDERVGRGMLNSVVVRALTVLSLCFQLAKNTLIYALH